MEHIGIASKSDAPRIVEIMLKYGNENGVEYDEEYVITHVNEIISSQNSIILTSLHNVGELKIITGFLSMLYADNPFLCEKLAIKTHWLIDKDYPSRGLELLRAAERMAKLHGARRLLVSMPDSELRTIMERAGFELCALEFKKELRC